MCMGTEPKVYSDRSTSRGPADSLAFYFAHRDEFGEPVRARLSFNDIDDANLVLTSADGSTMILTAVNGGYRGAGPSAAVRILVDAGFGPADYIRPLVESRTVRDTPLGLIRVRGPR